MLTTQFEANWPKCVPGSPRGGAEGPEGAQGAGRRNKGNIRICCRAVRLLWHFSLFFPQHPCCSLWLLVALGRQHDSLTPAQRLSCTSFETNPAQIHNSFPHLK